MWFFFALLSALLAGMQSFLNKVAAEKKCDTYYVSAGASIVTFIAAIILFLLSSSSLHNIPPLLYWLAIVSGLLYISRTITQLEALRFIDAAIFFPLYKVIGPVIVTIIGVSFLHDRLTSFELLGIGLSCLVPLLLITRAEHGRQKNLKVGLVLMIASTVLAAFTAADNALAVQGNESFTIPFMVIAYGFSVLFGIALYLRRFKAADMYPAVRDHTLGPALSISIGIGLFQFASFYFLLRAFSEGGLSLAYTINAHYILIPVLLSIWIYREHWSKQKAFALVVSMLALFFLHG